MAFSSTVRGSALWALLWKEGREVLPLAVLLSGAGAAAALTAPWWSDNRAGQEPMGPLLSIVFGILSVFAFGVRAAAADAADGTRPTLRALPTPRWLQRGVRVVIGYAAVLAIWAATTAGGSFETDAGVAKIFTPLLPERTPLWIPPLGWFVAYLWVVLLAGSARSLAAAAGRAVVAAVVVGYLFHVPREIIRRLSGDRLWWLANGLNEALEGFWMTGGFVQGQEGVVHRVALAVFLLVGTGWILLRSEESVLPRLRAAASAFMPRVPRDHFLRWNAAGLLLGTLALPGVASAWLFLQFFADEPRWLTERGLSLVIFTGVVVQAALLPLALFGRELGGRRPWFWRSLPLSGTRWFTVRFLFGVGLMAAGWGVALVLCGTRLLLLWWNLWSPVPFGVFLEAFLYTFGHPLAAHAATAAAAVVAVGVIGTAWSRRPLESGVVAVAVVFTAGLLMGYGPETLERMEQWTPTVDAPFPPWQPGLWILGPTLLALSWLVGAWSFHRRVA